MKKLIVLAALAVSTPALADVNATLSSFGGGAADGVKGKITGAAINGNATGGMLTLTATGADGKTRYECTIRFSQQAAMLQLVQMVRTSTTAVDISCGGSFVPKGTVQAMTTDSWALAIK